MTLYSLAQAADMLGISTRTVRRLMGSGAIGWVAVGTRRKGITSGQLLRFIRSRSVKAFARNKKPVAQSMQRRS